MVLKIKKMKEGINQELINNLLEYAFKLYDSEIVLFQRLPNYVNAKRIFTNVLLEKTNITKIQIGKFLFVDHTMIIFYEKNFKDFMKYDDKLRANFEKLNDYYKELTKPVPAPKLLIYETD